ncbi:MAG: ATP-binding protein, partial [Geminicoccaceae bacterium]
MFSGASLGLRDRGHTICRSGDVGDGQYLLTAPEARPLFDAEFNDLMEAVGPFEASPVLAVAVSGGPDSLALLILASRWATSRGGRAIGLTVDHGLRTNSAEEAEQTGQ